MATLMNGFSSVAADTVLGVGDIRPLAMGLPPGESESEL
jgi:hypothetical protein